MGTTTASDSGQSHERWELHRHRDEADALFRDTTKLDDELLSVCCMSTMKRQASVKNMVESVKSQFFVDCEHSVHVGLRRTLVCGRGGGVEQSAMCWETCTGTIQWCEHVGVELCVVALFVWTVMGGEAVGFGKSLALWLRSFFLRRNVKLIGHSRVGQAWFGSSHRLPSGHIHFWIKLASQHQG